MWKFLPLLLFTLNSASSHENNKNHFNFDIVRHKSSIEQFINHGDQLSKFGFENIYGKGGNRTNDSIALHRFLDDEFYSEVLIGHPAQKFNMAFDVSWNLAWVISSKCSSLQSVGCYFHNKYNHDKSSEYKPDGRPYSMDVGKSVLAGIYSYDNISIAHSNVTNQSFVEMIQVPKELVLNKADGILGLGLKVDDYDPFFYTLLNQNKIKEPIFSIFLNRDKQSDRGGNIMLGFIDKKKIHQTVINNKPVPEEFTYLNVDNLNYWQFPMDRIIVNNNKTNGRKANTILCTKGCKAIVDSSSNTIYGPRDEVFKIHDDMGAKELFMDRYLVNCDTVNKLPPIDFVLNGKPFTLEGAAYTVKMSYYSVTVCLSAFVPANTADEENRWVLGGAFLSEYYSVYNVHAKTVGFVKAA